MPNYHVLSAPAGNQKNVKTTHVKHESRLSQDDQDFCVEKSEQCPALNCRSPLPITSSLVGPTASVPWGYLVVKSVVRRTFTGQKYFSALVKGLIGIKVILKLRIKSNREEFRLGQGRFLEPDLLI